MLELAVDLVAEEPRAALCTELDDTVEHVAGHRRAGRVVRGIDVDETRVRTQRPLQRIEVVHPAVRERAAPLRHLRPRRAGKLERRLVAGRLDDHVIAGLQQGMVGREDAFLGGRDDDHVLGAEALVDRRDRAAQLGCPGRLGVPEPQSEEPCFRIGFEREQVGESDGFGVARGEHVRGGELVQRVVLLDAKRRQSHDTRYWQSRAVG